MTALTQLGKYELDPTPLGQGAMGVVYRAFDPDLKQAVAIKVIRKELLEGASEHHARERFKKEAIAAAASGTRTSSRCTSTGRMAIAPTL